MFRVPPLIFLMRFEELSILFCFSTTQQPEPSSTAHTTHQRVTLDGGKHKQSKRTNLCVTPNPSRTPDAMLGCSSEGPGLPLGVIDEKAGNVMWP